MSEGCRAHHNAHGLEVRGSNSRIAVRGDDGKETVSKSIDRQSRFVTRTRVIRSTATSFSNKDRNVLEKGGGRVVFATQSRETHELPQGGDRAENSY